MLKNGNTGLSRKRDNMLQIQDMLANVKPDIVLNTVKRFNIKELYYYNFDFFFKVLNWELLSSSCFIKCLL